MSLPSFNLSPELKKLIQVFPCVRVKDYSFLLVSLNLSFHSSSFIRLEAICTPSFRHVCFDVWLYKPKLEDMEYILVGRASTWDK